MCWFAQQSARCGCLPRMVSSSASQDTSRHDQWRVTRSTTPPTRHRNRRPVRIAYLQVKRAHRCMRGRGAHLLTFAKSAMPDGLMKAFRPTAPRSSMPASSAWLRAFCGTSPPHCAMPTAERCTRAHRSHDVALTQHATMWAWRGRACLHFVQLLPHHCDARHGGPAIDGHVDDGGDAAGRRGARARGYAFPVHAPRLVEMRMQVHHPGRHHGAADVEHVAAEVGDGLRELRYRQKVAGVLAQGALEAGALDEYRAGRGALWEDDVLGDDEDVARGEVSAGGNKPGVVWQVVRKLQAHLFVWRRCGAACACRV